ncbi:hypothetical protein AciM339_1372 [Aciduliprofundum sp. MAR08-339]|uniref:hypothetical protein n=1 Tax=Aciduliprofundum sp. (strain MAR08-339) TaxID=673860 RepID=UPI0002A49DA5|nr:hypothetical protein AciM339_1372 [Aciduliprofundum sp. MAR08-339]
MVHKLKIALKIYSTILLLCKIGIIAIILLAILSFASENVTLEGVGQPFLTFNGEEAIIHVPVTIKNYGMYSIDNISVRYTLRNSTTTLLTRDERIGNIETSSIDTFSIPVKINLLKLYNEEYPSLYHFKHADMFYANITISLQYMLNWVHVSVNSLYKFRWVPPIEEVKVYAPENMNASSGMIKFEIPYSIKTAGYLSGLASVYGHVLVGHSSCGSFNGSAQLGEYYRGTLKMEVLSNYTKTLLTKSQHLTLQGNISIFGLKVPFTEKYYWGAPLSNLTYKIFPNETLYYSFTDKSPFKLSMKVTKIFYYEGNEVSKSVSSFSVFPNQEVRRYEKIEITQPVDEMRIIFYDTNTHLTYQEVIHI